MKRYIQTDATGLILNFWDLPDEEPTPEGWTLCPASQAGAVAVGLRFVADLVQPKPTDPRMWWVGVGVFFDRFLTAKMAVLTSTNAVAKALILDAQVRPYIDLKSTALAQGLATLQAQNIAGLTPAIVASITTNPTTEAERHVKGLA